MPNDAYSTIREAILNRHQVVATYSGYEREMCPHILGTKRGRPHALFYQFGGGSRSGLEPDGSPNNWRCILVEELSDVRSGSGEWHTASNRTQPQTCVDCIDVEASF